MTTLILLFVSISILILVHEAGHFYSARFLKVKVEEFGFGFPPRVFSRVKNGIRYSLNLLPFGGFVKIFGEHGEGEGIADSFISRPAWQRLVILGAGVFMNLVLAWVAFSIGAGIGTPALADDNARGLPVSIVAIAPGSPAEQAGLRFGDQIVEMRSRDISLRVESEKDVHDFINGYRGEGVTMMIRRGNDVQAVNVIPRAYAPEGEGPLGIVMGRLTLDRTPWYAVPIEGAKAVWRTLVAIISGLGMILSDLIIKRKTDVAVTGPIGMYMFGRDVQMLGLAYIFQFVGMLSVNLAVLNALPIPALDGGRMFFLIIEKIKGSRLNPKFENAAHAIGFTLLIVLMILVTYKDIIKLL